MLEEKQQLREKVQAEKEIEAQAYYSQLRILMLTKELQSIKRRSSFHREKLQGLQAEIQEARTRCRQVKLEEKQIRRQYNTIKNSTIWRSTLPLRILRDFMKKDKKSGRREQQRTRKQTPLKPPGPQKSTVRPLPKTVSFKRRRFDVILAADFCGPSGTIASTVEEIKVHRQMGWRTGLIQLTRYDCHGGEAMNSDIQDLLDAEDGQVQMLAQGEQVACPLLILKDLRHLQEPQAYLPHVKAGEIWVVIGPPGKDFGSQAVQNYDIRRCQKNIREYFGKTGVWYPPGPRGRETLQKHYAVELEGINLAPMDWTDTINAPHWRRPGRPLPGPKVRVGRYTQDGDLHWPQDAEELLMIYPAASHTEVYVLGGAGTPQKVLGFLPENWHVLEFGEVAVRDFLASLDVFVYYPHPGLVESSYSPILEAMAVGLPVILPPRFQDIYGEAAIYAKPSDVKAKITALMTEAPYYDAQVEKAYRFVDTHFSPTGYTLRTEELWRPRHEEKEKIRKRIARCQGRIHQLGFVDRGLADLEILFAEAKDFYQRKEAAWALALWHADQRGEAMARRTLDLLPVAVLGEKEGPRRREAAILEAQCRDNLGDEEGARRVLSQVLEVEPHADIYLALANLELTVPRRLFWLNQALAFYGLGETPYDPAAARSLLPSLPSEQAGEVLTPRDGAVPMVTVILPAGKETGALRIALDSLVAQTWAPLEILVVVDDSSEDNAALTREYAQKDSRVRLISAAVDHGPYALRNIGLQAAAGDFVVCQDPQGWSHRERIARQVRHLLENPHLMATPCQEAWVTEEGSFVRREKRGLYIFYEEATLMFRRREILEAVGYWDMVRFGAENEFMERLQAVFGSDAVAAAPPGLLSFKMIPAITGDVGEFTPGAQREYRESFSAYHANASNLRYDFPQDPSARPFPVPGPLMPGEVKPLEGRHFDVILVSDFRLPGGTTSSNVEEILAQKQMGLQTGLIQMSRYDLKSERVIHEKIRELLDGDRVQMLVQGERVSCDLLILKHPPILGERQIYLPDVEAGNLCVIMNQTPFKDYGPGAVESYDIRRCRRQLKEYFGKIGVWYPIGPLSREALLKYHAVELADIPLAPEDWVEVIDVRQWRRPHPPAPGAKIRIGRHSRDHELKWPGDPDQLLAIYPADPDIEVHVLGGADAPQKILGSLPENWHVLGFGEMPPRDFLAPLDIFVYYPHPELLESFGRVIMEAMAVGVPAILPPRFREVFGEAASYAEPFEVKDEIYALMKDPRYYESQVEKAYAFVEAHFGYTKHASRIKALM